MKPESKFWQLVKKNTPKIKWTRLESWASFGVPDLLGYNNNCGFFMCELKVARGNKVSFSPHQIMFHSTRPNRPHQIMFHSTRPNRNFILLQTLSPRAVKLYESSAIHDLIKNHNDTPAAALDDWKEIQRLLINA